MALRSGTFGTQSGIFGTTVKVLISTISTRGKLLQKHLEAEKENFVAAAFSLLLDSFGFNEPGKSRLLELKPNYIDAFAWMLYSFTQPGLEDKRQGYVYNRLIARDPPPEDFRLFAQLPPPVWNLFYKADRYGYPVPEELKPTFELWCKVYSGFFSAEPFEERTEEESIAQASEADEVEEKWLGTLSEMEGQLDETLLEGLRQCRVVKSDESERWAIFVRDLFLAWQLGQVREMVEATLGSPLEVRDWNCGREISPEVMNLKGLSPLAPEVWRKALAELALQMSQSTFNDWLRDSRTVGWIQDEEVIIGVRSERARGWLENRLRHLVERTLSGILGHPVSARFVVMYSGSLEG